MELLTRLKTLSLDLRQKSGGSPPPAVEFIRGTPQPCGVSISFQAQVQLPTRWEGSLDWRSCTSGATSGRPPPASLSFSVFVCLT